MAKRVIAVNESNMDQALELLKALNENSDEKIDAALAKLDKDGAIQDLDSDVEEDDEDEVSPEEFVYRMGAETGVELAFDVAAKIVEMPPETRKSVFGTIKKSAIFAMGLEALHKFWDYEDSISFEAGEKAEYAGNICYVIGDDGEDLVTIIDKNFQKISVPRTDLKHIA